MRNILLDLLYPPKCVLCRRLLQSDETDLCGKCRTSLPDVEAPFKRGRFFRQCHSVWYYEDNVAQSLRRFKFADMPYYSAAYGKLLAMRLLRDRVEFDVLTWVPVSAGRKRKRGYDQTYLLAKETARQLNVPCVRTLKKAVDKPPQSSLPNAASRQANVKNAYCAVRQERFVGKRVLLIDDIITTGATLSESSSVLLTAGAASVECATLAAVRPQEQKG